MLEIQARTCIYSCLCRVCYLSSYHHIREPGPWGQFPTVQGGAGLGTIFPYDKVGLAFAVVQVGVGKELRCDNTLDLELSTLGILDRKLKIHESGPTTTMEIKHRGYFLGSNDSS